MLSTHRCSLPAIIIFSCCFLLRYIPEGVKDRILLFTRC